MSARLAQEAESAAITYPLEERCRDAFVG